MNTRTLKRLLDAADACAAIAEFTAGVDVIAYRSSQLVRSAVERQFAIVGEALGKAAQSEPNLHEQLSDVPKIIAFRNRLIHGYDSIDADAVWSIVQTDLPALETELRRVLREHGEA